MLRDSLGRRIESLRRGGGGLGAVVALIRKAVAEKPAGYALRDSGSAASLAEPMSRVGG